MSPVTSSRHSRPYDLTRLLNIIGPIARSSFFGIVTDEDLRGRTVLPSTCFTATCLLKNCSAIVHYIMETSMYDKMLDDCCMQLLIIMDGERNHSMGSPMDGTPPQSEDQQSNSDRLMKDKSGLLLSVDL